MYILGHDGEYIVANVLAEDWAHVIRVVIYAEQMLIWDKMMDAVDIYPRHRIRKLYPVLGYLDLARHVRPCPGGICKEC